MSAYVFNSRLSLLLSLVLCTGCWFPPNPDPGPRPWPKPPEPSLNDIDKVLQKTLVEYARGCGEAINSAPSDGSQVEHLRALQSANQQSRIKAHEAEMALVQKLVGEDWDTPEDPERLKAELGAAWLKLADRLERMR